MSLPNAKNEKKLSLAMPEYHQSAITMFQKCQKQYEFRYIMGLVVPPKAALTVGGSVDDATTLNFVQKVESKTDLPMSDALDAYSTSFDRRSVGTDWEGENAGKQKDVGALLVKLHHTAVAPNIQPRTVQEQFRLETDAGYALGGTLDLTDENEFIRDTKTSSKAYDADAVSKSVQAAMYDFAYEAKNGQKAKGFAFDVLKKTKTPEYQEVVGEVTQAQRSRLFQTIGTMHRVIKSGDFMYSSDDAWWCSKHWCGYWHLCKGKK